MLHIFFWKEFEIYTFSEEFEIYTFLKIMEVVLKGLDLPFKVL